MKQLDIDVSPPAINRIFRLTLTHVTMTFHLDHDLQNSQMTCEWDILSWWPWRLDHDILIWPKGNTQYFLRYELLSSEFLSSQRQTDRLT